MKTVYEYNGTLYENMSTLIKEELPPSITNTKLINYIKDEIYFENFLDRFYDDNRTVKEIIEQEYCKKEYENFVEDVKNCPDAYDIFERRVIDD